MQNATYEIQDTDLFPLTRIQKLISERMLKSKQTKPCFYIKSKADVTELMAVRANLSKASGVKITSNALLIRALALAAKQYPVMTARLNGQDIRAAEAINVGFAVHSPQGLVVPVIKDADKKSVAEIARQDKLLTEKARSNKLTLADMEGETIALSNLGVYGIDYFFGIVPPQASTILAVGNVVRMVVPHNNSPAVRKMMSLTVAADRTVADENYAAQFLGFIKEQLQNPRELI